MIKTVFWGVRVPEPLDEIARDAAKKRGMNLSEFVRYALNRFFDDYATNPNPDIETDRIKHNLP